jgi:hypothetical protein
MRVLIVGSLPRSSVDHDAADAFRAACREVGHAVASRGWSLSVGTDRLDSADKLVVEGAGSSGRPVDVHVYFHDREPMPFRDGNRDGDNARKSLVNFVHRHGPGNWVSGRVEEIRDADVVLLLGGGDKTAQAFHTASALSTPCIPVPGLGGASNELWGTFAMSVRQLPLDPGSLRTASEPWRPLDSARAVLEFAERYVAAKPYSGRTRIHLALIILFVLSAIAGWGYLFFGVPPWREVALFAVILAAAVMGTALNWFVLLLARRDVQVSPAFSWPRAGAAVIEAFALFVLLLIGSLAINGDVAFLDELADRPTYLRLATIGSLFGFAAGFMTESITTFLAQRLYKGVESVLPDPKDGA